MSDILDLNFWVIGNDPRCVFPIKIAKSETVGGLMDAIKDKMMSDTAAHTLYLWKVSKILHVNIDDLILWKVSILVDHSFKDTISQLKFKHGQSLLPWPSGRKSLWMRLRRVTSILSYECRLLVGVNIFIGL